MTINIQELLDKGYKEFPPTRFDTADKCFQKRFRAENGDTLYFININMYYSWGTISERNARACKPKVLLRLDFG